jgi:hypothetical protein
MGELNSSDETRRPTPPVGSKTRSVAWYETLLEAIEVI